ncbi:MAG: hypothetical protein M5U09_10610 [Gammaproteobacteria bacterium]|nr:hypothetical protein [Gammaproteobacteria bacterium]
MLAFQQQPARRRAAAREIVLLAFQVEYRAVAGEFQAHHFAAAAAAPVGFVDPGSGDRPQGLEVGDARRCQPSSRFTRHVQHPASRHQPVHDRS